MSDAPWPPPLAWPDEPLTDGVVTLDRLTLADAGRVAGACADPDTQRWLPLPNPYGDPEAHSFITSRQEAADSGQELTWAVRGAEDATLAGALGLSQRGRRNEAEIGYWTAPDRRGRGWTARAVRLAARHALQTMPLRRVEILTAIDNEPSRQVATTSGATFEGIRRRGLPTAAAEDAAVYAFIAPDFEEIA